MEAEGWYVGCACDRRYVVHTATMLASLDINGKVPEAVILVAGFGLTDEDHRTLEAGAGAMADKMVIYDVKEDQIEAVGAGRWTAQYPPAVIGRLFLADLIGTKGARLLTIDSDMIVNVSLRPLFGLDLFGSYVAACHDVPRHEDLDYFNSGIMLLDVDRYKQFDVARRALDWLSSHDGRVLFPDQDALNEIVGHIWYRLDHRWNFHCNYGEQRAVTSNDYERSYVAHFAAKKPWDDPTHPGLPLYRRYREELARRAELHKRLDDKSDAAFVALAFRVFLGRELSDASEYSKYDAMGAKAIIRSIIKSTEFLENVLTPLIFEDGAAPNRFAGVPCELHRRWARQRLHLSISSAKRVEAANCWADLLKVVLRDTGFRVWSANVHLLEFADIVQRRIAAPRIVDGNF